MTTIWIGLVVAGAVGATCRYVVDVLVSRRNTGDFPWETLLINVSGSLLLGLLTGAALYHAFPSTPKTILGTGFCGAYTTFSTWTFETIELLERRQHRAGFANAALSLALGAAAAGAGLALASI